MKNIGKVLRKKILYIILISLVFVFMGIGVSMTKTTYIASEKILISSAENELLDTYKELIKSSVILKKVVVNMNLNMTAQELSDLMNVQIISNTNMIEINVLGENSEEVKNISIEIAKTFIQTVAEIYEKYDLYDVDTSVKVYIKMDRMIIISILSGIVGFGVSTLFFVIGVWLDTKIKSDKDIENITGLRSLISIQKIKAISKKELNITNINSYQSDIFKTLMTNIQFLNVNNSQSKSIVITSSVPLEGKTYISTNLAMEFAKAGKKVILIDSNMRSGRIDKIFNLPNDLGFSNYLSNLDTNGNVIKERITRFIKDTEVKRLNVITSGNIPPNPTELLKSAKVKQLIKDLKVFYDVIIFDTVSVLEGREAEILSKNCDLTLIMSAYGKTKKEELERAYNKIKNKEGSVIGIGFNQIPEKKLVKKLTNIKNSFSKKFEKIIKKITLYIRKFFGIFILIGKFFIWIYHTIQKGIFSILNLINIFNSNLKNKSEAVKNHIQNYKNKREKIKLIEAGAISQEENIEDSKNNIIKEVFEKEITQLESNDKVEKKLDNVFIETNLELEQDLKNSLISEKEIISKIAEEEKNKNELEKDTKEFETKNDDLKVDEEVIYCHKLEKNKEEEKRIRDEMIKNYKEIDFRNPENLTEEMIRKQVEMDDMIRLAEQEERQEKQKMQQMKLKEKSKRRKERKEKLLQFKQEKYEQFQKFIEKRREQKDQKNIKNAEKKEKQEKERIIKNEAKKKDKIKKEAEKNENRARMEKVKEEKRVYREKEKQKHKEEIRIKEELQEDNLYPKPRI